MEKDLVGIYLPLNEWERREVSLVTVRGGKLVEGPFCLASASRVSGGAAPACACQAGTRGPGAPTASLASSAQQFSSFQPHSWFPFQ